MFKVRLNLVQIIAKLSTQSFVTFSSETQFEVVNLGQWSGKLIDQTSVSYIVVI